jgi:hypothetical protein
METTATILRELWRRRRLVGLAAAVAILIGAMLTYRLSLPPESRQYDVGMASTHILVDTPQSQVVDVSPRGSGSLGARATLLANLMTEGEVKAAIARRAGLPPNKLLAGVDTGTGLPPEIASSAGGRDVHLLTTRPESNSAGEPLPIIALDAQAPDPNDAARLASAAVEGLRSYLDSKAATEDVSAAHRLEVRGLGEPQVTDAVRGPQRLVGLGAAVFVFLCGCVLILVAPAVARAWRAASEEDPNTGVGREGTDSTLWPRAPVVTSADNGEWTRDNDEWTRDNDEWTRDFGLDDLDGAEASDKADEQPSASFAKRGNEIGRGKDQNGRTAKRGTRLNGDVKAAPDSTVDGQSRAASGERGSRPPGPHGE